MSLPVNYESALRQAQDAGLEVLELRLDTTRPVRCKVAGERGQKGWYSAKVIKLDGGDWVIVGAFGVWHGNDPTAQKFEIPKSAPRTKEENAAIRKRIVEDKKRAAAELKRQHDRAAAEAVQKWREYATDGDSAYLARKQVHGFGVRFHAGMVVVPVTDTSGKVHGLQFILDKENPAHKPKIAQMDGSDKRFWPNGMAIAGHFHMIGAPVPGDIILVTEGYATGASLHMATGHPVAVVFNANNVLPALLNLQGYYNRNRFLICADDDYLCRCGSRDDDGNACRHQTLVESHPDAHPSERELVDCQHCGKPHLKINTGVSVAIKACMTVDAARWIVPQFTTRIDAKGKPVKLTDFNDLHVEESLQAVAAQLTAAVETSFPAAGHGGGAAPAREPRNGGAGKSAPKYMSVDEACDRFSLIYGVKETMFDHELYKMVPRSCVMDVTPDHAWREMKKRSDFRIFDIDEVGFDPSGRDERIRCNMWSGWPTEPDSGGSCEKLLELLQHMCADERDPRDVYKWIMRWLAYPIQNPGAKMKTALVVHGGQGVGKNMFFEAVMKIYGRYGFIIGQDALEDSFNDWLSSKLFLLANEIVARQELFHAKNRIKGIITEDTVRIRAPFMGSRWEANHVNLVFLSNEAQPVVLDPDDRRFMAIWTPKKREPEFYQSVLQELANGGVAALHHHLLNLDLGDFNPGTPPLATRARLALIEAGKESPDRFVEAWMREELDVGASTCALADLYDFYVRWCRTEGERFAYAKNKFSAHIGRREDVDVMKKGVLQGNGKSKVTNVVVPECDPIPAGEAVMKWLGEKVKAFHDEIRSRDGDI